MVRENECSMSCAYAFLAYKTAWLSYYYPVEWAISCMTLDSGDNDKIRNTLNACKKRNIKVLQPSINHSKREFSVDYTEDGTKAIRYGFLAIKGVGYNIAELINILIQKDGEFTSFDDFYERTVDTSNPKCKTLLDIINNDPKYLTTTGKVSNPFKKTNIVPLILAGAFDEFEPNRHILYNKWLDYKKDKAERKDINDYHISNLLQYELEYLGSYVSRHPLDGKKFPYVDLNLVQDNERIKVAGIFVMSEKKVTKNNKVF